jgi:hypothetical protein
MSKRFVHVALLLIGGCVPEVQHEEYLDRRLSMPGSSGVGAELSIAGDGRVAISFNGRFYRDPEKGWQDEAALELTIYLHDLRSRDEFQVTPQDLVLTDSSGESFPFVPAPPRVESSLRPMHFFVEHPEKITYGSTDYELDLKVNFRYKGMPYLIHIPHISCRQEKIRGPFLQ